ncbi:MAG TPA: Rho termination factor N-terminal domain-containing protein [Thermoleophilaceae bacterium]|nr:Rho termination factor N-terminal domain-containing protein [Thermoleophilaceae bacterium]
MAVLQRKELEKSTLADLHAIASELGVEGFRGMRKADLVAAILRGQGSDDSPDEEHEPDEVPAEEALEPEDEDEDEEEYEEDEEPAPAEEEPEVRDEPLAEEEIVTGVLDVLPNGSAFMRADPAVHSREDVYVSPAQIRRCELRSGDEVSGPVRPARRNERHPSLVHVEKVNGADAEPPAERPHFADLTPVFASERLAAPPVLEGIPYGLGSRVLIAGPPGAGSTTLLREIVSAIRESRPDLSVQVALVGVRPEEVAEWAAGEADLVGGSFDSSPEPQAQAAELAVERAKRRVEQGANVVVVVDSLEGLSHAARRRVFSAGRSLEEGGSLTVIATAGESSEALRWATTRIVLEPAGPDSRSPQVAAARSGTLRTERL